MSEVRVLHYLNQFFAGIGGEDHADTPVGFREGPVGPGKRLQALLGEAATIVGTAYCGDNTFAEQTPEALEKILALIREHGIHLLVTGPAFAAGRFGFACIEVAHYVSNAAGIPGVTGMYPENPGVDGYQKYKDINVFLLPTSNKVTGMDDALSGMAQLLRKLATGKKIGSANEEGYIPRGLRLDAEVSRSAADRAVDMLLEKLAGKKYESEIPIEIPHEVPGAPPVTNMQKACLAIVSTAGVHPKGNPHGFKVYRNTQFKKYDINRLNSMLEGEWEVVHGGYNAVFMNENPNFGVPLDACRELLKEGAFARLYGYFYGTTGVEGLASAMEQLGKEMAEDMKGEGVNGALLVST